MNRDQRNEILESLMAFVKRISADVNASPAEVAALPEIARLLNESVKDKVSYTNSELCKLIIETIFKAFVSTQCTFAGFHD